MAVGEAFGHGVGVDPAVDHWCRVDSELRSRVGFEVRVDRSWVILMSRSWLLAANLPVVPELSVVLEVEEKIPGLVSFLLSTNAPSSKEPSLLELASDDRLMLDTVDRSSAAAGPATLSAVTRASFSSSRFAFTFRGI